MAQVLRGHLRILGIRAHAPTELSGLIMICTRRSRPNISCNQGECSKHFFQIRQAE